MSSLLKWIIGGIVALIVLIIVIVVSIPLLIDPNDYKDKISQTVKEQTGRELSIPGDIKLSISPSLKAVFKLGDVSMSSNRKFQETDFFSSELVEINLALWPLISSKTLQINNISLKRVNVNLVRNKSGAANWEDLAGGKKGPVQQQKTTPAKEKQPALKSAKELPKIDIGGITIADINVTFTDQQADRTVKLSNFNLDVGHIMENKPFPVNANFTISIDDGKKPLTAKTGFSTNLTFDLAKLLFLIDKFQLQTNISGAPVPVKVIDMNMTTKADIGKSRIDVSDLLVKIDDTTIKGKVSIADLQKPFYSAAIHIDELNLDRFTPEKKPEAQTNAPEKTKPPAAKPRAAATSPQKQPMNEDPEIIPVELLRGLNFDAEIKIDKLIAAKLVTTNILINTTGKEGLVRLQPFSADLYHGTIMVNGDIDARQDEPEIKLTKVLKGVEMGPLFMDLKGKEEVKGTADIRVDVTTRGKTKKELTRNSNGTMKLGLVNGEIAKLKIIDTIRIAKKLYEGGSDDSAATGSIGKKKSGRPTSFADLSASGVIANGVITNEDLLAQSELMKVTGKGKVNLNTEEIDYLLTIYLAKKLERDEEKDLVKMSDTPIPYKVTGTFDKIDQSAALGEVLKAGAVKLLSKELEKQLGGDSKDSDSQKPSSSTEDLINKGLKSLFGK